MGPVELRLATGPELDLPGDVERDAGRRFAADLPSIAADESMPVAELLAASALGRVVVAEVDGRVVGYAWWSILDDEAHLEQLSVRCEVEGQGIGRRLIHRVAAGARAADLHAVTLTTFRDIAWNGPLYERYGFEPLDEPALPEQLAERRRAERESGLDVLPRIAMRRIL